MRNLLWRYFQFLKVYNDVIVVNFLSLKIHFTFKNLIFCMDFSVKTCLRIYIGWFINTYD
jgi:hypothetical protein